MKRLVFALTIVTSFVCISTAYAQQRPSRINANSNPPSSTAFNASSSTSTGELKTTPEMWFYQQERNRYDDPAQAVRRNAAFDAAQRKQRITAMKWYGFSASRPMVNPTPFGSPYSPTWTNGGIRPWSWAAQGQVLVSPR